MLRRPRNLHNKRSRNRRAQPWSNGGFVDPEAENPLSAETSQQPTSKGPTGFAVHDVKSVLTRAFADNDERRPTGRMQLFGIAAIDDGEHRAAQGFGTTNASYASSKPYSISASANSNPAE
jgi:hypothetical protein